MFSLNSVTLVGHLANNPEQRTDQGGRDYVTVRIATNRNYRDNNGKWQTYTSFNSLVARNGKMERLLSMVKGQRVLVEGSLDNGFVQVTSIRSDKVKADSAEEYPSDEVESFEPEFGPGDLAEHGDHA